MRTGCRERRKQLSAVPSLASRGAAFSLTITSAGKYISSGGEAYAIDDSRMPCESGQVFYSGRMRGGCGHSCRSCAGHCGWRRDARLDEPDLWMGSQSGEEESMVSLLLRAGELATSLVRASSSLLLTRTLLSPPAVASLQFCPPAISMGALILALERDEGPAAHPSLESVLSGLSPAAEAGRDEARSEGTRQWKVSEKLFEGSPCLLLVTWDGVLTLTKIIV